MKNINSEDISISAKETAVSYFSSKFANEKNINAISELLTTIRPFLLALPKAKSAKLGI